MNLGRQIRCMSAAAQGYKQVVEDNRNLYNTLQDLKGFVHLFYLIFLQNSLVYIPSNYILIILQGISDYLAESGPPLWQELKVL